MKHGHWPVAWTVAGTDPSAGAGIQADLKTFHSLGVYGCTVITAVIAQNTQRVERIEPVPPDLLKQQLETLADDVPPAIIKTGMLASRAAVETASQFLATQAAPVICDPVIRSSSGTALLAAEAIPSLVEQLFPRCALVTPNLVEAQALTGLPTDTPEQVVEAAHAILAMGPASVLVKGGHHAGAFSQDFWTNGQRACWLTSARQPGRDLHGSGCSLSSAIAAAMALGYRVQDALVIAKAYINQGFNSPPAIGQGRQPLRHGGWPMDPAFLPWITPDAESALNRPVFPDCGPLPLGVYPLVDSAEWVRRVAEYGATTIQLRIKEQSQDAINAAIQQAVKTALEYDARLFINDYWQAAIQHGAYGVHLGQDDLDSADLHAIARAGLRLGTSTHNYYELARVNSCNPSYLAIGTVFASPSKPGLKSPLGLSELARLAAISPHPVVAIGGLHPENATAVSACGVAGLAVISDIRDAANPRQRVADWIDQLSNSSRTTRPSVSSE